jgi:hypothetical protein
MKRQLTLTFASLRISHLLILLAENRSVGIPKMPVPVPFFGLVSQAGEHTAQLCVCSPLLFSNFCSGRVLDGSVSHSMEALLEESEQDRVIRLCEMQWVLSLWR